MLDKLIENIKQYNPKVDEEIIKKACEFADKAHDGQLRNSGEKYIIHPLHVALILSELNMDTPTIVAGLLHDVIEDTDYSYDDVASIFGKEIADLVDGVTKL